MKHQACVPNAAPQAKPLVMQPLRKKRHLHRLIASNVLIRCLSCVSQRTVGGTKHMHKDVKLQVGGHETWEYRKPRSRSLASDSPEHVPSNSQSRQDLPPFIVRWPNYRMNSSNKRHWYGYMTHVLFPFPLVSSLFCNPHHYGNNVRQLHFKRNKEVQPRKPINSSRTRAKRSLPSPFQLPPKLSSTGHGPLPISSSDWGTSSRADGRPKEPQHSTKPTKGATQHFAG